MAQVPNLGCLDNEINLNVHHVSHVTSYLPLHLQSSFTRTLRSFLRLSSLKGQRLQDSKIGKVINIAVKAHYKVKQSKEHKIEDTAQVHKDHALIHWRFPFIARLDINQQA